MINLTAQEALDIAQHITSGGRLKLKGAVDSIRAAAEVGETMTSVGIYLIEAMPLLEKLGYTCAILPFPENKNNFENWIRSEAMSISWGD